jgi:hypothetical protein
VRSHHFACLCLCGAAMLIVGCRGGGVQRVDDQRAPFNRWTIDTLNDESISNAIVAQHTLYPYHFDNGSAQLNSLGERDVKVLAAHYVRSPGELNIRRGGADTALYEARVQSVTKLLTKFDVPAASIKVADKLPGGDGVSSERAVTILKRSYESSPLTGGSSGNTNGNAANTGANNTSGASTGSSGGTKQ